MASIWITVLLLAGCSTAGPAGAPAAGAGAAPPAGHVPIGAVTIADGMGSEQADGVFPRTVRHYTGTTTIARKPQRVAIVSGGQLDAVLSLGVVPVGATNGDGASLVPGYLTDAFPQFAAELKKMASFGLRNEPDVESIAAARPDLIIANQTGVGKLHPQLSKIAPTIMTAGNPDKWRPDFMLIGDALGLKSRAQSVMADIQKSEDQLKRKVPPSGLLVSLVRFGPSKARAMGARSTAGMVLADLGIHRPNVAPADDISADVSNEELAEVDGQWIFFASQAGNQSNLSKWTNAALWSSLSAVQAKKAIAVSDEVWFQNAAPAATARIVADLSAHL